MSHSTLNGGPIPTEVMKVLPPDETMTDLPGAGLPWIDVEPDFIPDTKNINSPERAHGPGTIVHGTRSHADWVKEILS